jgi:hypothetical protein
MTPFLLPFAEDPLFFLIRCSPALCKTPTDQECMSSGVSQTTIFQT